MNPYSKTGLAAMLTLCSFSGALASDPVTFTFDRSGTTAASVTVNVNGAEGVTAELTSVSTSLKSVSSDVVCPDVNANTSPTITMVMTVNGLPTDFTFNTIGLDIHALNASGAYQAHNDNKTRQWNVNVATGTSESTATTFATLSDIDIAAGVNPGGDCHQLWYMENSTEVAASSPMVIKFTITKGTTNEGCFFGLSSVTLSTGEVEPEIPEPSTPTEIGDGKCYTIKWKNNTSSYMTEGSDGGIVIGSYSTSAKIFWELIPTDNEDCYYIRNTASGLYIGSCNMTPSSASKVQMSSTPVEYYIHLSASTSGENKGCWWMSSTDCANYNNETSGARCLNKDGASTSIITWTTGLSNIGSYWTLTESEDLYEVQPFTPAEEIGKADHYYHIIDIKSSKSLNTSMEWVDKADTEDQKWYFVGTSNAAGGYQIVNASTPINSGAKYIVSASKTGGYNFTDASSNTLLSIDGVSDFTFSSIRSDFSRILKVYCMPCGSTGNNWVARVQADNGYSYPLSTNGDGRVNYPLASKATRSFDVYGNDVLDVPLSGTTLEILLGTSVTENTVLSMHVDYDGDGVFDYSEVIPVSNGRNATAKVEYNGTDTQSGRVRLRLDENGSSDPEADLVGQTLDLVAKFYALSEAASIEVAVNDPTRGKAEIPADGVIEATPYGTSLFLYWKSGKRVMSTDARYEDVPTTPQPMLYTAFFSPNLMPSGIDETVLGIVDSKATIDFNGTEISVNSTAAVNHILVFGLDGNIAASNAGQSTLSVAGLQSGVYIVKAITASGVATSKIIL